MRWSHFAHSQCIQLSRMPHRGQHHSVIKCALTSVFGRRLLHWTVKAAGGHAAEPTAIQKVMASKQAAPAAPAKAVAPHVAKPMGPNVEMLKLTRMADLPAKFRRKPFSEEELATINVSLHVVCIRRPTIPFPRCPPPIPPNILVFLWLQSEQVECVFFPFFYFFLLSCIHAYK